MQELRNELVRKDELLQRHYEKIAVWQNLLSDLKSYNKSPAHGPAPPGMVTGQVPTGQPTPQPPPQAGIINQVKILKCYWFETICIFEEEELLIFKATQSCFFALLRWLIVKAIKQEKNGHNKPLLTHRQKPIIFAWCEKYFLVQQVPVMGQQVPNPVVLQQQQLQQQHLLQQQQLQQQQQQQQMQQVKHFSLKWISSFC